MAKNNVKTIINTLNSKLRKQNITNSDRKEVKTAFTQLAAEIADGYKLGIDEATTLRSSYSAYKEDVTEAIAALPREQQIAFAEAIKATTEQTQEQEETKEEATVVADAEQETTTEEATVVADEQEETKEEATVVADEQEETKEEATVVADEQQETTSEETNAAEASEAEEVAEPEPLSEEEKNKYLDEIRSSHTLDGYIATIEYPIRRKNIEATLALGATMAADGVTVLETADENRAMALANVDDMLVAMDYCTKNGQDTDLDGAIVARLQNFRMEDITPDNAYALLALADKIKGNTALYDEITGKIATALRDFDVKNFAPRIQCPIVMGIGLQDNTCPPHINFASYNLIPSEKKYYVYRNHKHGVGSGWWPMRAAFFRKILNCPEP